MTKVLIPLPSTDFDPTETGVPWKILHEKGIVVEFATPNGQRAICDPIMLTGQSLGPLSQVLAADAFGKSAFLKMAESSNFKKPIPWSEIAANDYQGLILPGGHAKGMRPYLESTILQETVRYFFSNNKPIGAICHGVVLAARTQNALGKSALYGRKSTSLLKSQELLAWNLTRLWLKDYYRTYSITVEEEVTSALGPNGNFVSGPLPFFRDNPNALGRGFCVKDNNYLSARWPGDAHLFGNEFLKML